MAPPQQAVVVDLGADTTKAGCERAPPPHPRPRPEKRAPGGRAARAEALTAIRGARRPSGGQNPAIIFHSLVTKYRLKTAKASARFVGQHSAATAVGAAIETVKTSSRQVFQQDLACDCDALEAVFDRIYSEPAMSPDMPLLLTETLFNPVAARQVAAELLFETFGVPRLQFAVADLCSYMYNRWVGEAPADALLVGVGHAGTTLVPVVGGEFRLGAARRVLVGGEHCSRVVRHLAYLGQLPPAIYAPRACQDFKHQFCRCSGGDANGAANGAELSADLQRIPDIERYRGLAAECLFRPALVGSRLPGLGEAVGAVLDKLDAKDRAAVVGGGAFLTGGSTQFPGFAAKLQREAEPFLRLEEELGVRGAGEPALDGWRGARVVADWVFEHEESHLTKARWEEQGVDYLLGHDATEFVHVT